MGAKTTAFTNEIQKLTGECAEAAMKVQQAVSEFKPLKTQYHALTDKHAAQVNHLTADKQWIAGSAPARFAPLAKGLSSEQYIDADPLIKSLNAQMSASSEKLEVWMEKTDKAKRGLQEKVNQLTAKVNAFDAYVKAKEAKWFAGKKSVPAAKEVIKVARVYIRDFTAVANAE